ncbi:DUF885 domain-containing protein [Ferrimonas senticii]|uniref:DUF885 domain-containing protein n=1 Tax=Ferrimonas senticii TaxID=394566 RepID=UPI00040C5C70|nr:DUF885 domain-containing protein [Ferrimonas senticii]
MLNSKCTVTALALATLLSGCAATPESTTASGNTASTEAVTQANAEQVRAIMDASWQLQLSASPMLAKRFGDDSADARLPDYRPETLSQRHQQQLRLLTQANAIATDGLSPQQQADLAIVKYQLQNQIDSYRFNEHQRPISAEGGFHSYLAGIARNRQLQTEPEVEAYLSQLQQVPQLFAQQQHWLSEGARSGNTVPRAVLTGFDDGIRAFIGEAEASLFYQPFANLPADFPNRDHWQQQGLAAVSTLVIPSYQGFLDFYLQQYLPAAQPQIGASALPNGGAYYDNRVRHFTTLEMTAEQVHQLGLDEVARIRAEMLAVIDASGFDGDFEAFLAFLRSDPQFYPKTANELLYYAAHLSKQADAALPKLFNTLPVTPYGIKPVPAEIAPKYTTGRYSPASSATDAGYYWVNTYALGKRPLYEMEALTLHEAVPGHHLQIALASELDLHPLRRSYYISAFGEGWGLYAEKLGLEMGFYQDPYSNFGRLTYEMWRACRLVVDTGIHAKGWSRQQAIDYLAANTALSLHNVTTEIDRYIGWPGQALSYKIGELTLWRLRHQAEQQLGDAFDIRQFHDQLLQGGSMPLGQLEQQIQQWITQQQQTVKS